MMVSRAARSVGAALLLTLTLAACEDQYRQDPLFVRGSSDATVFAYGPIFVDRPIAENIDNSLALADYNALLKRAGLKHVLAGPKPMTVFAVIDPAIDNIPDIYRQRMLDPANEAGLRQLVGYTIVPGHYSYVELADMARRGGGRTGLLTLSGTVLTIELDPATNRLSLVDPSGRVSQLVLADIRQSNGVLYAGNTLLAPD